MNIVSLQRWLAAISAATLISACTVIPDTDGFTTRVVSYHGAFYTKLCKRVTIKSQQDAEHLPADAVHLDMSMKRFEVCKDGAGTPKHFYITSFSIAKHRPCFAELAPGVGYYQLSRKLKPNTERAFLGICDIWDSISQSNQSEQDSMFILNARTRAEKGEATLLFVPRNRSTSGQSMYLNQNDREIIDR